MFQSYWANHIRWKLTQHKGNNLLYCWLWQINHICSKKSMTNIKYILTAFNYTKSWMERTINYDMLFNNWQSRKSVLRDYFSVLNFLTKSPWSTQVVYKCLGGIVGDYIIGQIFVEIWGIFEISLESLALTTKVLINMQQRMRFLHYYDTPITYHITPYPN